MNKDLSIADQVLNNKDSGKWITTYPEIRVKRGGNRTDNSDNEGSRGRGRPDARSILKNHGGENAFDQRKDSKDVSYSSHSDNNKPYDQLNISDTKLANIKSPVYLKLETMIDTLQMIRTQLDGKRIPKFEA